MRRKQVTSISIDSDLYALAKKYKLNISKIAEIAIVRELMRLGVNIPYELQLRVLGVKSE